MFQKRKKVWTNRFQTRLCFRIAFYFLLYQAAVWASAGITQHITVPLEVAMGDAPVVFRVGLLATMLTLLAILFIRDTVCFTHRLVGPLVRFREVVKAVAAGEEVALVRLRKGDYLMEFKDEFNEMLKALEERGAITIKPEPATREQNLPVAVH